MIRKTLRPKGQERYKFLDPEPRIVIIEKEDEFCFVGRPESNANCPDLVWPKFAWEEIK